MIDILLEGMSAILFAILVVAIIIGSLFATLWLLERYLAVAIILIAIVFLLVSYGLGLFLSKEEESSPPSGVRTIEDSYGTPIHIPITKTYKIPKEEYEKYKEAWR